MSGWRRFIKLRVLSQMTCPSLSHEITHICIIIARCMPTPEDYAAADHPLAHAGAALADRRRSFAKSGWPWPREPRQND
jgi:hypothetical protein